MKLGGMNLANSQHNFYNLNMRDNQTVKMSTHITGRPTTLYETNQQRLKMQSNFENNRKFFKITHTECTKQNVKESVDLSKLADLPEEYMNYFSNKTILKDKGELAQLAMDQRIAHEQQYNKHKVYNIQKECILNCDINEGAKMIARE